MRQMTSETIEMEKITKNFIESEYFTVSSLVTQRDHWLSIDKNEKDVDSKLKEAKERNYFNLVVKENGYTVGFINTLDLKNSGFKNQKKLDHYLIQSDISLCALISKFVNNTIPKKRNRSPMYFVQNPGSDSNEPIGIVTYWDLNRAPAYIFSFAILVYLEHTLLSKIEETHKVWDNHDGVIERIKDERIKELIRHFVKDGKYNFRKLSKWGLPDLLTFYKEDNHITNQMKSITDKLIKFFYKNSPRNRIAHPVNLLIRDNIRFASDLKKLNNIWNFGKQAYLNFLGPKVSYSP